jgi:hypothetical protein
MSSEANYSLTIKVNGDLFTVRGDNADAFQQNLVFARDVIADVEALQAAASGKGHARVLEQAFPTAQPVYADDPFAEPAPRPTAPNAFNGLATSPTCSHGPMKHMPSGVSKKTGKPYAAFWACTSNDRATQCPAKSGA